MNMRIKVNNNYITYQAMMYVFVSFTAVIKQNHAIMHLQELCNQNLCITAAYLEQETSADVRIPTTNDSGKDKHAVKQFDNNCYSPGKGNTLHACRQCNTDITTIRPARMF